MKNYYNRFDPKSGYDRTLFLAGRGLQSAELNEAQDYAAWRLKEFGDALFSEGSVVEGCMCVVDQKTGITTIESGAIYVRGAVRRVDAAALTISLDWN